MQPVSLIFADDVEPRDFHRLIESLGGEVRPAETIEARLSRGRCHVWVVTDEDGLLEPIMPEDEPEYEDRLGAPPRRKIVLDMSDEPGADLLAFEVIEAAATRWRLVVDDNEEFVYTVDELRARVAAGRPLVFSDPGRRVVLHFGEGFDGARFLDMVVSLGGVNQPEPRLDVLLSRGRQRIWVTTTESAAAEVDATHEEKLGVAPRASVTLYLSQDPGTDRLALEIVEAAATHWPLVVDSGEGTVFTVEELRVRSADEANPVFPNPDRGEREGDDR